MTTPTPPAEAAGSSRSLGKTARDVTANTRLTATTGALLLAMLAVEGFTVLDVRGMITLHIFLGVMLIGPVLLKIGSTLYRFMRYYTRDPAYVSKGPPHLIMRVLGPLVTLSSLSSLSLFGTGIALIWGRNDDLLLTAHQASFIIWCAVMTVHVLGHLREALVESFKEIKTFSRKQLLRLSVVGFSLALGVGVAATLLPSATPWTHQTSDARRHHRP